MSTVILESFSQSSKAYKLGYIIVGYALASLFFQITGFSDLEKIASVAISGSFIGTTIVFVKPLKFILYHFYDKSYQSEKGGHIPASVYYSPYLEDEKGEIYGGILFSSTCFLALIHFFVNFSISDSLSILIVILLPLAGLFILILTYRRYNRLKSYFDVLNFYYDEIKTRVYNRKDELLVDDLRLALNRKDWNEAHAIKFEHEIKGK